MTLLLDRPDVKVFHADWRGLLAATPRREDGTICDALIVDAPYSERTHGHDVAVTATRFRPEDERRARVDKRTGTVYAVGVNRRREITYSAWSPDEVEHFVDAWAPVTRGWFGTLTDHVLVPAWEAALERHGRYVFAPLACVEPGSRVRLSGDGPAQWSTWLVVARPRVAPFAKWGSLPGAYVMPPGHSARKELPGGKHLWLMRALVRDYTRPGDLVCDPCCGAGTTLLAAVQEGRRALGGDVMEIHAQMASRRLGGLVQQPLFGGLE